VMTKEEHLLTITWSGKILYNISLSAILFANPSTPNAHRPLPSVISTPTKDPPPSVAVPSDVTDPSPSTPFMPHIYARSSYASIFPTSPRSPSHSSTPPCSSSPSCAVEQIASGTTIGVFGVVFTDGKAALISIKQTGEKQVHSNSPCLRKQISSNILINSLRCCVGIGCPFRKEKQCWKVVEVFLNLFFCNRVFLLLLHLPATALRFNPCNHYVAIAYRR